MPRQTRAAQTLTSQVKSLRARAKPKIADTPDGLGVHRALSFDKPTSKWLHPILETINDPRVASLKVSGDVLTVTFVAGPAADSREPFPLKSIADILNEK